jgi:hypothetical protein
LAYGLSIPPRLSSLFFHGRLAQADEEEEEEEEEAVAINQRGRG